ncbi:MAG TPA: hypothetical protein GX528_08065 [Firmicutes bacterium]|nr:hypothetical protein [Bacillota bacterium]
MLKVIVLCLSLLLLPGPDIQAAENCSLDLKQPVLITSVGQNLDALIISSMLAEMGAETVYLPLAKKEDLYNYKQIIISPGVSYKGLAAAGLKFEDETKRVQELVEAAGEHSCQLILIYLGGFIQGDARSQKLIDLLAPNVDVMVIYQGSGGPIDYFLATAAEKGIPVHFLQHLGNLCEELAPIFSIEVE